jgi:hypothetical protein
MKFLQNLSATSIAIDFCPDLAKRVRGDGIATVAVGCNEFAQIVLIVHLNKQESYRCLQPHLRAFQDRCMQLKGQAIFLQYLYYEQRPPPLLRFVVAFGPPIHGKFLTSHCKLPMPCLRCTPPPPPGGRSCLRALNGWAAHGRAGGLESPPVYIVFYGANPFDILN